MDLGFVQSDFDQCLYIYKDSKTNKEIFVACYVDDLLITGDKQYIDDFVEFMSETVTVRDLGQPKSFLGMEIVRDWNNYWGIFY